MPRTPKAKLNGKQNRGGFRPGQDRRRHQLTAAERKFGGEVFKWLYIRFPVGTRWDRSARFFARLQVGDANGKPQKRK